MRSIIILLMTLTPAISSVAQNLSINEIMSANVSIIADEDEDYPDWIELYNGGTSTVNLNGYGLSDDPANPFKWVFPSVSVLSGRTVLVFASGKDRTSPNLHTNFKIKSSGETLLLTHPSGTTTDTVETGHIPSDISRGRQPDGGPNWSYFADPTPDAGNTTQGYPEIAAAPLFSHPAGLYSGSFSLTLSSPSPNAVIYYTTDGSPPTNASTQYLSPIPINATNVIRSRAYEAGKLYSEVNTHSFIFADNHDLTVISISTDPDNLWDWETGIYVLGPNASSSWPYYGANFWEEWEKPIHIEFFEPDGVEGFSIDAGVMIYGGWCRAYPMKSLAIYARDCYCYSEISYTIFPDLALDEFEAFLLRNSGNDWPYTMMRDAMMTGLVDDTDLDHQAYRPSILFLNGEYWGIHNIREKMNDKYLESHRAADPENIDMLKHYEGIEVVYGDTQHYDALCNFVQTHDMTVPANYEYVKTQMDVFNYMDYEATEIYAANTDWPAYNVKLWRPRTPDGIWKWMLYDTEVGLGLWNTYTHNTLQYAAQGSNNNPARNLLFIQLLNNSSFRSDFINHFADLLNFNFKAENVNTRIDTLAEVIEPEMPNHKARWSQPMSSFTDHISILHEFTNNRVHYVREDIQQYFNLPGQATVHLNTEPPESGQIQINTKTVPEYPWEGVYFQSVPIQLTAIPGYGYRFLNWIGAGPADSISITVNLTGNISITAVFEPDSGAADSIVINEINYNSAPNFDPEDWVELYNNCSESVNLSDWIFKDSDDSNAFIIPSNTILASGEFLVICRDTAAFSALFPEVDCYFGNLDFNISNGGELIRLYDSMGELIDSLTYDDAPPWPPEPDGNGPTLELIDPSLPNEDPANWQASFLPHGSPGQENGRHPPIGLSLTPHNPPILIPASGGRFGYGIEATNSDSLSHPVTFWCNVTLPNGSIYGPVLGPLQLTMASGLTIGRSRTQDVPGAAPAGIYTYNGYAMVEEDTVTDNFQFEKLSTGDGDAYVNDWFNSGESFNPWLTELSIPVPSTFAFHQPYPSPCNPTTTFTIELPVASWVKLEVFDISGRRVWAREPRPCSAGLHAIHFDGSGLASGIYLARLEAGDFKSVTKMVLMK